ncbi:exodeoxyribonuclease VII large subunit [Rickettsiales bacterium]|jgi:exodeoxyribonuclease VII large subunit|nr:exodeoxyribonuclease VII large subunit [Rickettsiales bacterium]
MNVPEYGVCEFSNTIKKIVEDSFGYIRIRGEITGFREHRSSHLYFSLKENDSIISAICFSNNARKIDFKIDNGIEVIASGRVTTYGARSNYQIIVEKIEIAGIGSLLKKIEETRIKLEKEGLFSNDNKQKLVKYPKNIGIITSKTGAVIEDIKHRINQRYPLNIKLYNVSVQGSKCVNDIISGIEYFNRINDVELIIIARGGGSFEDLLPFNDELMVRSIYKSKIPIISAIGHETDSVLIDYVADLRAPTPSAAAELITPNIYDLKINIDHLFDKVQNYCSKYIIENINIINSKKKNLIDPKQFIGNNNIHIAHIKRELLSHIKNNILHKKNNLLATTPNKDIILQNINLNISNLANSKEYIKNKVQRYIEKKNILLNSNQKLLEALSYKNTLRRGFSIAIKDSKVLTSSKNLVKDEKITIEFYDGKKDVKIIN